MKHSIAIFQLMEEKYTGPRGKGLDSPERAATPPNTGPACLADEYRSYSLTLSRGRGLFAKTPGIPSISLPWHLWARPVCSVPLLGDSDVMKGRLCPRPALQLAAWAGYEGRVDLRQEALS